ncbi:MAG TPA: hypothetical protein PLZ68_13315, partial [Ferruginibacter sp.]|nr:hypothetical protein [Ferruginibacter sp.]
MKKIIIILLICFDQTGYAQKEAVSIRFRPVFDSLPIETDKKYPYKNDSIEISVIRFYVSNISFYQNNQLVAELEKKNHLVDIENPASQLIQHIGEKKIQYNSIHFSIGVDSLTNVSGAMGGDLDPVNGMYWTWQSGYINFKLEGKTKLCPARKNQFTYHIGGYEYPYNTLQQVELPVVHNNDIMIDIDIRQLLNQLQLNEVYEVMSPGEKAMVIAKNISSV